MPTPAPNGAHVSYNTVAKGVTTSGVPDGNDSVRVVAPFSTTEMLSVVGAAETGDEPKTIAPPPATAKAATGTAPRITIRAPNRKRSAMSHRL
jgi:hypothetical protein